MAAKDERGFASMDRNKQRAIASKGGHAAHERGTAHEFTSDEARQAGRKGGLTISRNREHMAQIGRRGGQSVSRDRANGHDIAEDGIGDGVGQMDSSFEPLQL